MKKKQSLPKPKISPLKPGRERLLVLNQLLLPHETSWVECHDEKEVANSIKVMHVRGAPAIGIAAAYGYYLGVWKLISAGKKVTASAIARIKNTLDRSRPTAINLFWATERMAKLASNWLQESGGKGDSMSLLLQLYSLACEIHQDDAERCYNMSRHSVDYLLKRHPQKQYRVLTHCNTGALATGGIGTALGVIRLLHNQGKVANVIVDETRPYLQGSRLTALELKKEKVRCQLVVDSMAGYLMQKGEVDFVVLGADRITANGDVANKIGTYSLSVLAKQHGLPFLVVAPESTFDMTLASGRDIPVEERSANEVLAVGTNQVAARVPVLNYSFDITPRTNISAIINENGVWQ